MKKILLSLIIPGMLVVACPPRTVQGAPYKVLRKDGWELKVWVTAKGTRSEGQVSHLYHNGTEVCPVNGKNEMNTPLGRLQYVEGKMPWGWHGWKPVSKRVLMGP